MPPDLILFTIFAALLAIVIVAAYGTAKQKYCCMQCDRWWQSTVTHVRIPDKKNPYPRGTVFEYYNKRVCSCGYVMHQRRWHSSDPDEA